MAAGIALEGQKVLLIDLDPQVYTTIGIGIEPESCKSDIHNVLLHKKNINDIVLNSETENLYLAPSHIRLDRAEQQLAPEIFRETFLHKAIRNLDYDFIIIDCRLTLGTLTINALYACNFAQVPCEMGRYSLDGFADLMETIEKVKKNNDFNMKKSVRILLTKY